jgi:16S rRNA (guanine527-N7)-methyltransferase
MARAAARGSADRMDADRARVVAGLNDSREIVARLDAFVGLLLQWQAATNLIAPSTIPELWTRHIADSLQLLPLAPEAQTWVDLGSGGGFPGMVLACALAGKPGAVVHLVESNRKKAAFLREAVRVTGAPAQVHAVRVEDFVDGFAESVEIVTARALAPLENLLAMAHPLLKSGATALFMKGQDVDAELTNASKYWTMDVALIQSTTDPTGRIVQIRSIRKADTQPLEI